jgi:biotin synthase-like enzyme
VNTEVRKRVCPDKNLGKSIETLGEAEKLGLKKAATIVLGLGEDKSQIPALLDFVHSTNLDRITIYSLNPHRGTPLSNSPPPASLYQAGVIALLRINFPELEIIGGTWIDQLPNIGLMLLAGANGITKYPLFSMFGNRYGMKVEEEVRYANRRLLGTFSDMDILAGKKKLQRNKDPRRVLKGRKPQIPGSIIEKVEAMRGEIGDKIESYVETVVKRRTKFTQPSPRSRRSLKRCQRTRLSSYRPP